MTLELARVRAEQKPWGAAILDPWSEIRGDHGPIGELCFERADLDAPPSELLLKMLFIEVALSIQVHPDDAFARSIGLPNGKTEAWYILDATPEAKVAVGLKHALTANELRIAIENGSIADLVQWRSCKTGDIILVPAGTIHAIGPGLVIAEIQQRSDVTFRLFDHGRGRELHIDRAIAATDTKSAPAPVIPEFISKTRDLLVADKHFVLERITLPPDANWRLEAGPETWFLAIDGQAGFGSVNLFVGEAVFLEGDSVTISTGSEGLTGLLAYPGHATRPEIFQRLAQPVADVILEPYVQLPAPSGVTPEPPIS